MKFRSNWGKLRTKLTLKLKNSPTFSLIFLILPKSGGGGGGGGGGG